MAELDLNEKRLIIYSGERIKMLKQEQESIAGQLASMKAISSPSQQQQINKIYLEERLSHIAQEKQSLEAQWIKLSQKQKAAA